MTGLNEMKYRIYYLTINTETNQPVINLHTATQNFSIAEDARVILLKQLGPERLILTFNDREFYACWNVEDKQDVK